MKPYEIWKRVIGLLVIAALTQGLHAESKTAMPTPPDVWKDYNPDAGDFKEEIVAEQTQDGIYCRESYISAYVLGEEIRVYCKYSVKAGSKNAPGLMDVHGWMGQPAISRDYVNDGWAVMAHDYCGKTGDRPHYTKYPEKLRYGNMDAKVGYRVKSKTPNGKDITDPGQTDDYLWYAIQRRALSYLLAQKEVDKSRIGANGFSYGGTIMWNLGMDPRVKAVVAYFGVGYLEYYRTRAVWMYNKPYVEPEKNAGEELYLSAIAPQAHAPFITAATLWLNGSNDHHGGHERGCGIFKMFKPGVPWDFAIQARGHHNTEKLGDDCKLWLEKHVLGKAVDWPARPESGITLDAEGVPEMRVTPAAPEKLKEVRIHYALKSPNNIERSWRDAEVRRQGNAWVAKMPVLDVDDYVFGFANLAYEPNIVISSDFEAAIPSELGKAVATDKPSSQISEGTGMWSDVAPVEGVGGVNGFRVVNQRRGTTSGQFSDPKWHAPEKACLSFRFYCTQPQTLQLVAKDCQTDLEITASDEWQVMVIPAEFLTSKHDPARRMDSWQNVKAVSILPKPDMDITKVVFADFKWVVPAKEKPVPDQDGKVYLTPGMAGKVESFWRLMTDQAVSGSPIRVGGKVYKKGLGVHADSEITFPLGGGYTSFHVVPGPDDAHHGNLEMKILIDGKEVFASGVTNSRDKTPRVALDFPLKGATSLTLVVTDGGDGNGGDHASWADAFLLPEG